MKLIISIFILMLLGSLAACQTTSTQLQAQPVIETAVEKPVVSPQAYRPSAGVIITPYELEPIQRKSF